MSHPLKLCQLFDSVRALLSEQINHLSWKMVVKQLIARSIPPSSTRGPASYIRDLKKTKKGPMKKTIICIASIVIYILAAGINLAQAQEQSKGATVNSRDETSNSQFQLTDLLAQARPQRGRGISLMPVSSNAVANGPTFVITPASVANLPVVGPDGLNRATPAQSQ